MKPAPAKLRFGHWEVTEKLGGTDHYTEYRATNAFAGGAARLRVYQADPYQPEDLRKAQINRIANAYRALSQLPLHPTSSRRATSFPPTTNKPLF